MELYRLKKDYSNVKKFSAFSEYCFGGKHCLKIYRGDIIAKLRFVDDSHTLIYSFRYNNKFYEFSDSFINDHYEKI